MAAVAPPHVSLSDTQIGASNVGSLAVLWRNRHRSLSEGSCQSLGAAACCGDYGGEFQADQAATGRTNWSQRLVENTRTMRPSRCGARQLDQTALCVRCRVGEAALDQGSAIRPVRRSDGCRQHSGCGCDEFGNQPCPKRPEGLAAIPPQVLLAQ